MKLITKNWHKIDPLNISTYIRTGGYEALRKAIREMSPEQVIGEVKLSGLQGRGGGGFPTGEKWELSAKTVADEKYFICNLDESEPGVYKDRLLAENNPHQIIEGLVIGATTVGAKKAFIYMNGHYDKQEEILKVALEQAEAMGFAGRGIIGSALDVEVKIFRGAGAYVCGEETALISTIEGKRGEPRLKPPYPPVSGLFGKPTVINNAETLANLPYIIRHGGGKYNQIGCSVSPGTKLFVLEGAVRNRGIHEAPLGITIYELVFNSLYGGGLRDGKEVKFVQVGGASGRLVPQAKLDHALAYGAGEYPLGCGSILVVDKSKDMKDFLFAWADFFHRESCGQCVPCREGTFRLWEIAKRMRGHGLRERDKENVEEILWTLKNTSFCPLGSFAATAWSDAIKMFGKEIFK